MDKKQRRRMKAMLAELDTGERNRLMKRAARMRKAAADHGRPGARRPQLDELAFELLAAEACVETATFPADTTGAGAAASPAAEKDGGAAALIVAGTDEAAAMPPAAAARHGGLPRGVVVGVGAGTCRVRLARPPAGAQTQTAAGEERRDVDAVLPDDLARRQRSDLAVGDEVLIERLDEAPRVVAVLPRRSLLSRADPHMPELRRAIAANVDLVVVVVAMLAPPLHPRLIDRYLVAVEHSGAAPVLLVNKIDLACDGRRREALAQLEPYEALGLPVLQCSAASGAGIAEVRAALAGTTCVFVGQSGVGKSSLLNALAGHDTAGTGAVRAGDGRGRHTTTASALFELGDTIRVIDTPGIRRFSVDAADPAKLATGFLEFTPYSGGCRFRDCTHLHEPGCAVRAAVAGGAIPHSRYVSYRKLLGGDGDDRRPVAGRPGAEDAAAAEERSTRAHRRITPRDGEQAAGG